jgi:hypothetical protein
MGQLKFCSRRRGCQLTVCEVLVPVMMEAFQSWLRALGGVLFNMSYDELGGDENLHVGMYEEETKIGWVLLRVDSLCPVNLVGLILG